MGAEPAIDWRKIAAPGDVGEPFDWHIGPQSGGKPSRGTKADKRLGANRPKPRPRPVPKR